VLDRRLPEPGQIEVVGPVELLFEQRHLLDPREPVGAELTFASGHQVPDAGLEHEAERVEVAGRGRLRARVPVAHPDAPVVPHRGGDFDEVRLVATTAEPARRVEVEPISRERRAFRQLFWQGRQQLQLGGTQHGAEAELTHRPGHTGCEQRLRLLGGQAGQTGSITLEELAPTVRSGLGVDGHTRRAQRLEVAVDRAHGDLERLGQLRSRHPAACLQQQEQ